MNQIDEERQFVVFDPVKVSLLRNAIQFVGETLCRRCTKSEERQFVVFDPVKVSLLRNAIQFVGETLCRR